MVANEEVENGKETTKGGEVLCIRSVREKSSQIKKISSNGRKTKEWEREKECTGCVEGSRGRTGPRGKE